MDLNLLLSLLRSISTASLVSAVGARIFRREVLELRIGQRLQEGNQGRFLIVIKVKRSDEWRQERIGTSARVVKVNDIFERGQASVMHVRCRDRHIAKRWSAKCSQVALHAGHSITAGVCEAAGGKTDPEIVEAQVRE